MWRTVLAAMTTSCVIGCGEKPVDEGAFKSRFAANLVEKSPLWVDCKWESCNTTSRYYRVSAVRLDEEGEEDLCLEATYTNSGVGRVNIHGSSSRHRIRRDGLWSVIIFDHLSRKSFEWANGASSRGVARERRMTALAAEMLLAAKEADDALVGRKK